MTKKPDIVTKQQTHLMETNQSMTNNNKQPTTDGKIHTTVAISDIQTYTCIEYTYM